MPIQTRAQSHHHPPPSPLQFSESIESASTEGEEDFVQLEGFSQDVVSNISSQHDVEHVESVLIVEQISDQNFDEDYDLFNTPLGGTFRPTREDMMAAIQADGGHIKQELNSEQISWFLANKNDSRITALQEECRIPGLAQSHIHCLYCDLPFAKRIGNRQLRKNNVVKGKYELLECEAARLNSDSNSYPCADCPMCRRNKGIRDDIYHFCDQQPVVDPPPGLSVAQQADWQPILKLGDTCACKSHSEV